MNAIDVLRITPATTNVLSKSRGQLFEIVLPHQASFATALSSGYLGDDALFVTQKQFCDSFGVSEGVCDRREIL